MKGDMFLVIHLVLLSVVNTFIGRTIFSFSKQHRVAYGEILGLINPLLNKSRNYFVNTFNSTRAILYGGVEMGLVSSYILMQKLISLSGGTLGWYVENSSIISLTTFIDSKGGMSILVART